MPTGGVTGSPPGGGCDGVLGGDTLLITDDTAEPLTRAPRFGARP